MAVINIPNDILRAKLRIWKLNYDVRHIKFRMQLERLVGIPLQAVARAASPASTLVAWRALIEALKREIS